MNTNHYEMEKPTESQLAAYLEKLLGPDKARMVLRQARDACGTAESGDPLLPLAKTAMWLSRQKGLASVAGHSMAIRIKFYNSIYVKDGT